MAYNLLVSARSSMNWSMISQHYRNTEQMFELFPIADPEYGDALGISIPTSHFNTATWQSVARFLVGLADSCSFDVYDLYQGEAVDIAVYVPEGLSSG